MKIRSGTLLARDRKQHGNLTQEDLAALVKSSRSLIAQREMGCRRPSKQMLWAFCQAMDLAVSQTAMLFMAFEPVPPIANRPLPCIAAVIRLDPLFSDAQAENLIALTEDAYQSCQMSQT